MEQTPNKRKIRGSEFSQAIKKLFAYYSNTPNAVLMKIWYQEFQTQFTAKTLNAAIEKHIHESPTYEIPSLAALKKICIEVQKIENEPATELIAPENNLGKALRDKTQARMIDKIANI